MAKRPVRPEPEPNVYSVCPKGLYGDAVPKTVENFVGLARGDLTRDSRPVQYCWLCEDLANSQNQSPQCGGGVQ